MKTHFVLIRTLALSCLVLASSLPAWADPLNITLSDPAPQPVYLGLTAIVPITIEPTSSGTTVTGLSAMLDGGLGAQPVSWNFDLVGHDCPGTMVPTTSPVRGVEWTGMGDVSGASPIQCSIEIRPRAQFSTPQAVTLRLDCNGCTGDNNDRDTILIATALGADVEVELQFNESEETGTIAGQLNYRNIGLGEARNLVISMFGDPALFANLTELDSRPGCNADLQQGPDSRNWTKTSLAPGESVQCRFNTTIPAPGSYILNALISADTLEGLPDPWPDNNSDQVTITATELVVDARFPLNADANPGDGICDDGLGNCSLRTAVDEANALPGRQTILVPYQAAGYFLSSMPTALTITDPVIISGRPDELTGALPWITRGGSTNVSLINVGVIGTSVETRLLNLDLRGNSGLQLTGNGAVVRHSSGRLLIENTKISGGWTTGNGGGLTGGTGLRLRNVEVFDNRAGLGGGMFLAGANNPVETDVTMTAVAIHDNIADGSGGGVFTFIANTTIDQGSIFRNEAVWGGGLYISSFSDTLITNSTISENLAGLQGGGLFQLDNARRTVLDFVTLAYNVAGPGDNTVGDGGGIYTESTDVVLGNSILAFNTARTSGGTFGTVVSGNCSGVLDSSGHNTIAWINGDPDCSVFTARPTDAYNLAPGLGALITQDDGISYYPLTRVNNEIDQAGTNCTFFPEPYNLRDNAGRQRPRDGDADGEALCDRGAYEAMPFQLSVTSNSPPQADWRIDLDTGLLPCSDAECTYAGIPPGTSITLTPVVEPGTEFTGWGGDCAFAGTGACTLDMTQSRSVNASFSATQSFPLSINVVGSGAVTSSPAGIDCPGACTADFLESTVVSLTADPEPGFELASWSGACSGSGICQVTMNQARNVTASFQPSSIRLSVVMAGPGTGRVTSSPAGIDCTNDCSADFPPATAVDLTASADAGSTFQNWTGACSGTGTCSVTMSAATTVGVVWIDNESIFIDGME
jgi:hypothetical protein